MYKTDKDPKQKIDYSSSTIGNLLTGLGCFTSSFIGITGLIIGALALVVAVAGVIVAFIVGIPGLITLPGIDEWAKKNNPFQNSNVSQHNTSTNNSNSGSLSNTPISGNANISIKNSNGNTSNTNAFAPNITGNSANIYIPNNTYLANSVNSEKKGTESERAPATLRAKARSKLLQNGKYGAILSVRTDHDVTQEYEKGMRIHIKFETYSSLKLVKCIMSAYFYHESGDSLKDFNNEYTTDAGGVAVSDTFVPSYDNSTFSDYQLFMPLDELHFENKGKYDLKYRVVAYTQDGIIIAESDAEHFDYNVFK